MDTPIATDTVDDHGSDRPNPLSRRGFLRGAVVAGGGLVAVGIAGCTAAAGPQWTYGPRLGASAAPGAAASPAASPAPSAMAHGSTPPVASGAPAAGHDDAALAVVKRFLGGESGKVDAAGNKPLEPKLVGGAKVFELTIDP